MHMSTLISTFHANNLFTYLFILLLTPTANLLKLKLIKMESCNDKFLIGCEFIVHI